jgi:Zn-dependent M28 family amino/carboxypeptidase
MLSSFICIMDYLAIIKKMDFQPAKVRMIILKQALKSMKIIYQLQEYATGTNMWVDLGHGEQRIGISCHFDIVPKAGGANDNAAACMACLEFINQYIVKKMQTPVRIFFFDEEELNLRGSRAYVAEHGVLNLKFLINLEMVGMGDIPLLWPFRQNENLNPFLNPILEAFETPILFDETPLYCADHLPFKDAGLFAFNLTNIGSDDLSILEEFTIALENNLDDYSLYEITRQSNIFKHYHHSSDTYQNIQMDSIYKTVENLLLCVNESKSE